jgi:hypothetical protein
MRSPRPSKRHCVMTKLACERAASVRRRTGVERLGAQQREPAAFRHQFWDASRVPAKVLPEKAGCLIVSDGSSEIRRAWEVAL